jgi:hypothetical protein
MRNSAASRSLLSATAIQTALLESAGLRVKDAPWNLKSVIAGALRIEDKDSDSWAKFFALGERFAKALCSGDLKTSSKFYGFKLSVSLPGVSPKTYTRVYSSLSRGVINGVNVVVTRRAILKPGISRLGGAHTFMSDGIVGFPCENPPEFADDAYSNILDLIESASTPTSFHDEPRGVYITQVPDFDAFDPSVFAKAEVADDMLVILSDGTAVNPVLLGALVASVGAPCRLTHLPMSPEKPVLASGPKGLGFITPIRRKKLA